jgi:hypothetical protein
MQQAFNSIILSGRRAGDYPMSHARIPGLQSTGHENIEAFAVRDGPEEVQVVHGKIHGLPRSAQGGSKEIEIKPLAARNGGCVRVSVERTTRIVRGTQYVTLGELCRGERVELMYLRDSNRFVARSIYVRSGMELACE